MSPGPQRRRIAACLLLAGLWGLTGCRRADPEPGRPTPAPRRAPADPAPTVAAAVDPRPDALEGLERLGDERLAAQVQRVVDSMDRQGRPPDGVVQGGRRGGRRGVFQNAEGRLPRRPPGYYAESDVWPRGSGGRGPARLIFGRAGEVYYSPDHYGSFVRLRGPR